MLLVLALLLLLLLAREASLVGEFPLVLLLQRALSLVHLPRDGLAVLLLRLLQCRLLQLAQTTLLRHQLHSLLLLLFADRVLLFGGLDAGFHVLCDFCPIHLKLHNSTTGVWVTEPKDILQSKRL